MAGESFYIKLGSVLYKLSGIPISTEYDRFLSKSQIAVTAFISSIAAFVSWSLHYYIPESISASSNVESYCYVIYYCYCLQNLIIPSFMILRRLGMTKIYILSQKLETAIKGNLSECGSSWRLSAKRISVILLLVAETYSEVIILKFSNFDAHERIKNTEGFEVSVWLSLIKNGTFAIGLIPYYLAYIAVPYNIMMVCILELEILERVSRSIQKKCGFVNTRNILETVKPDVEEGLDVIIQTIPISRNSHTSEFMNILAIVSQTNNLRVKFQSWYFYLISLHMINSCIYYPLIFVVIFHRHSNANDGKFIFGGVELSYLICFFIHSFAVFGINEWVKYKRRDLFIISKENALSTSDPALSNVFEKLASLVKDHYLDTPCVLFNIDLALVNFMVDTVVLLVTTFIM